MYIYLFIHINYIPKRKENLKTSGGSGPKVGQKGPSKQPNPSPNPNSTLSPSDASPTSASSSTRFFLCCTAAAACPLLPPPSLPRQPPHPPLLPPPLPSPSSAWIHAEASHPAHPCLLLCSRSRPSRRRRNLRPRLRRRRPTSQPA